MPKTPLYTGPKAPSTKIKFKLMILRKNLEETEAIDYGVIECRNSIEAQDLIIEMNQKGFEFVSKKDAGEWGVKLFFKDKKEDDGG